MSTFRFDWLMVPKAINRSAQSSRGENMAPYNCIGLLLVKPIFNTTVNNFLSNFFMFFFLEGPKNKNETANLTVHWGDPYFG